MTLGPELVLLNELEIPVAAVVVGHKYSLASPNEQLDDATIAASLERSRTEVEELVRGFLAQGSSVPFANSMPKAYRAVNMK